MIVEDLPRTSPALRVGFCVAVATTQQASALRNIYRDVMRKEITGRRPVAC
jgi:hypothetical protein